MKLFNLYTSSLGVCNLHFTFIKQTLREKKRDRIILFQCAFQVEYILEINLSFLRENAKLNRKEKKRKKRKSEKNTRVAFLYNYKHFLYNYKNAILYITKLNKACTQI